ncbi:DUF1176 domain-containing protein [Variovorax sp. PAMC 28711]|uniref:DUF1176 domain-containing protein n=1 Tax=Variovorax sp. PAMC 28711 TaxID=1795631 RepID=UPI00078CC5F6|nr:DUF1176 domain-containing protein [Variovorax sp. PAMC 28711]AMM25864.1 hypothetical protein AX767_17010 [Variovorax sp. PAMC 28711]
MRRLLSVAALSWCAVASAVAGDAPVSFQYKDWELVCDNTRTCRAAGYQAEEGGSDPVSMRITRAAGPSTPVGIDVMVDGEVEPSGSLRLGVGKLSVSNLGASGATLDAAQVRSVLPELVKAETVAVSDAKDRRWTLSLAGLNAVLLKMDEFQGRIGTPSALTRKGSKPESSVAAPVLAPVVKAVRPAKTRPQDKALAARIFPELDIKRAAEDCNNKDRVNAGAMTVQRLDDRRVLLSLSCGTGAYNDSTFLWVANDKPPHAAKALKAMGDFDEKDGSTTEVMKGRGVGDCIFAETWVFDGTGFTRTSETGDTMCRGFAGGAWSLPRFVARVVPASAQ